MYKDYFLKLRVEDTIKMRRPGWLTLVNMPSMRSDKLLKLSRDIFQPGVVKHAALARLQHAAVVGADNDDLLLSLID